MVALVEYPSRQAFLDMIGSPEYQEIGHLRTEALELGELHPMDAELPPMARAGRCRSRCACSAPGSAPPAASPRRPGSTARSRRPPRRRWSPRSRARRSNGRWSGSSRARRSRAPCTGRSTARRVKQALVDALDSEMVDEVWRRLLASDEAQKLVERIAEAPELRAAISAQSVGLIEDVGHTIGNVDPPPRRRRRADRPQGPLPRAARAADRPRRGGRPGRSPSGSTR